ncbi:hypothetical protein FDB64_05050 [Clostridium botulinum]|nr:hypothetical protein [Clostridium botulinum]NFM04141.1 hypothetical protein [Clostridium botulinum]
MPITDFFKKLLIKDSFHSNNAKSTLIIDSDLNQSISVFLNWAEKGYALKKSNSEYPAYMKYELSIDDPIKFHKEMIDNGYLCKPTLKILLTKLKIPQLKQILEENGQSKTGNKNVLIDRILNTISKDFLETIKSNFDGYVLSEKGLNFIRENHFYIDLHNNSRWNISLEEYKRVKVSLNFNASFNDVAWGIFNKRNLDLVNSKNWGLVRNNLNCMSELLYKEQKYTLSLGFLLDVLYYDLSGLENNNMILPFEDLFIAPGIIKNILSLRNYYNEDLIDRSIFKKQLPFSYFSSDVFKIIITDLFENGDIDLNHYKKYINTYKLI